MANALPVVLASNQSSIPVTGTFWQATQPVSGTFWQATQPVSLASLPALASGSNVIGAVTQSGTWNIGSISNPVAIVGASGTAHTNTLSSLNASYNLSIQRGTISLNITGTWSGTISFQSLDNDSNVISIPAINLSNGNIVTSTTTNGIFLFSGVPWQTISIKMTSYVSGTANCDDYSTGNIHNVALDQSIPTGTNSIGQVTANAGTNLNTSTLALEAGGNLATIVTNTNKIPSLGQALAASSVPVVLTAAQLTTLTPPSNTGYALDATLTGGNLISILKGGAKGTTAAAVLTSNPVDANTQALHVTLVGTQASVPVTGTFWQATQPISAASLPLPSGASTAAKQPALGVAGTPSSDVISVQGIAGMTKLLVTPDSVALPANQSVNISQLNAVTPLMGNGVTGTGSLRVTIASDNTVLPAVGAGATGSAVPANASYQGLDASTALPSAATAGNTVGAMSDKFGRQVVLPITIRDLIGTQTTTISASTAETTIVTAAVSTFNDLMLLVLSNTSATAARLDFRDTTAGSILFSVYLPAGDTRGFSMGGVSIPQTSVNTNWTAQSSASVTDLRVYAVFAKNK